MTAIDTAGRGPSVWTPVSKAAFERKIDNLKADTEMQGRRHVYTSADWPSHLKNGARKIPAVNIEQQLADDLSYISAFEEGVKTVTAATIEWQAAGTRVVLASNEGVSAPVREAFKSILLNLELCAQQSTLSDPECRTLA